MRTDRASRVIHASPQAIYQAYLDPESAVKWRAPAGMEAHIYAFDPREGGIFKMAFRYLHKYQRPPGKTSEDTDIFTGKFLELVPNERIVECITFETEDAAFSGDMTITTTLQPVPDGTIVNILCEDVPDGIRQSDHDEGIRSTLENLAAFTE